MAKLDKGAINIPITVPNIPVQPVINNNNESEMVSPSTANATYYQFTIEAYGWYNLDYLLKVDDGITESTLQVRLQAAIKMNMTLFLVIPDKKVFVEGGLLDDNSSYGFYTKDGKLPLPQGYPSYIFAIGEADEKVYFAETLFQANTNQSFNLTLTATSKESILHKIASMGLKNVNMKIEKSKNYDGIKAIDKQLDTITNYVKDCGCFYDK